MTELNESRKKLKNAMLEGDWDKAIGIVNEMKNPEQSEISLFCENYDLETGQCSERLHFNFFHGQYMPIPCPFYRGECMIDGCITSYMFSSTGNSQIEREVKMKNSYDIIMKIKTLTESDKR